MSVGEGANEGGRDGLAETEERPESAAQQDNIVAVIDRSRKRVFVGVEQIKCACQDRGVEGRRMGGINATVVFEKLGKEGQDECKGNLLFMCQEMHNKYALRGD